MIDFVDFYRRNCCYDENIFWIKWVLKEIENGEEREEYKGYNSWYLICYGFFFLMIFFYKDVSLSKFNF